MNFKKISLFFSIFWIVINISCVGNNPPDTVINNSNQVIPINWELFSKPRKDGTDIDKCEKILTNVVRYNLDWIINTFEIDQKNALFVINQFNENGIRPAASVCYALAVALQCTNLDEKDFEISREATINRLVMLIKGVSATYLINSSDGSGWGNTWQSALWATLVGQAAWMIWDILDPETQVLVQKMVQGEADRFILPGYQVPYWTAADGNINTPGDTKAEESAWNATILQLAVAMMPIHQHVYQWKYICSELMISSFSLKSDLQNYQIIDGQPVKDWLRGFNVRDDGAVINHNRIHPDYTVSITIKTRMFLTQSLAKQPVSQGAQMNASFIYRSLVEHIWSSPPYKSPGGTMYIPGEPGVYYPQGNDWSKFRFDIYYLTDVYAHILAWDKALSHKAIDWLRVRADRILAMQSRHTNGKMYAEDEFPTYPGSEQMVAWQIADAYLLFWLNSHNAISGIKESNRDWLSDFID